MREVLRGDGDVLEISSLLQMVEMEVLTGRLGYESGGEIDLYAGNVVRCRVGGLTGIGALMELFLQASGPFRLEVGDAPNAPALGSTSSLVLEGCRLLDDWRRVESLVLAPRDADELPGALRSLRFDGHTPTWRAVADARTARSPLVDPLLKAFEGGLLVEVAPPVAPTATRSAPVAAPAPTPTGPAAGAYEACIDEGRRCVRDGRLADARAQFSQALTMRPDDRIATQNLRRVAAMEAR